MKLKRPNELNILGELFAKQERHYDGAITNQFKSLNKINLFRKISRIFVINCFFSQLKFFYVLSVNRNKVPSCPQRHGIA